METGRVLAEALLGCLEVALLATMVVVPLVLVVVPLAFDGGHRSVPATMVVCCLYWEWDRLLREIWENTGSGCCCHWTALDATGSAHLDATGRVPLDATGRAHLDAAGRVPLDATCRAHLV